MKGQFADRMMGMQKSFIREILKVTQDPDVISFAGGLPNPDTFPVEPLRAAADKMLAQHGRSALQYAPTAGHLPLRQFIADRTAQTSGLNVDPEDILITNGSQQGLELVAKILLDPGDHVILESPSYLGGIQAFSLFQPRFKTAPLRGDGVDTAVLTQLAQHPKCKLFYALPNFQNPTGLTYSAATRQTVARILQENDIFFIEDDPYRELRFAGEQLPPIAGYGRDKGFLLGSFSKIVAPGLRLGWIVAAPPLMEKLVIAKQATDLHSNYFSQCVLHQFLRDNDLDAHIDGIKTLYRQQRDLMVALIEECFPPEVTFTLPQGGMFLWLTLPDGISTMDLFHVAAGQKVVFVPGAPFHVDGGGHNTMRLNYSNTNPNQIEAGMKRLATAIRNQLSPSVTRDA